MIKLFSDSDLDGIGCGLVAKIAFGDDVDVSYCTYRNLNERVEKFIEDQDNLNAQIYITDLAVNDKIEKKLDKRSKAGNHIQVVDHHITAMHFNNYNWGYVLPEYKTGKKTCATSLFYEFLLENGKLEQNTALEEFIELVRLYDTWEWEVEEKVEAKRLNDLFYIVGIEQFESEMLERLKSSSTFKLTDSEEFLLNMEEKKIERYIQSKNRQIVQTTIGEYCVGVIHAEQYLSELGNALAKLNPHLDLISLLNVGTKKIGFRTIYDEVDVSEFAKRYGGGGHPKASGCSMGDTAFELFVKNPFSIYSIRHDAPQNILNMKETENGTLLVNRKGEKSFVFLNQDGKWRIHHEKGLLEQSFDKYDEAERFIKRQFASGLAFDNELLTFLGDVLKKDEEYINRNIQDCLLSTKNHFNQ
ncbi:DHH family phosphoesterase [Fredinandcohnia quinoae]|uniref:Oligoribonuclease n=1 Tax=Fredinandcohnia quinoae TaxID=2918902 RepID=A0AAW5E092_9BACI|nr:oligoribonuclease [Fredinandcohnia sp. SECRCQ15]MCH1626325.1 oligoribonuclease [Fredinandcohnia sp. SECRCQ15]